MNEILSKPTLHKASMAAAVLLGVICFSACAVGRFHTKDRILEENFFSHERDFRSLLEEVNNEEGLEMVSFDSVRYRGKSVSIKGDDLSPLKESGFTAERWRFYQEKMQLLGLRGGIYKGADGVAFRVDPGTLSNGDSYKGYQYALSEPARVIGELDSYSIAPVDRLSSGGWLVTKHLSGNWYLYLFVAG